MAVRLLAHIVEDLYLDLVLCVVVPPVNLHHVQVVTSRHVLQRPLLEVTLRVEASATVVHPVKHKERLHLLTDLVII